MQERGKKRERLTGTDREGQTKEHRDRSRTALNSPSYERIVKNEGTEVRARVLVRDGLQ